MRGKRRYFTRDSLEEDIRGVMLPMMDSEKKDGSCRGRKYFKED